MEKIIVIGGSTASGKSDLAIALAKSINTEIISSDSIQIYRDLNIGTAKVTEEEMQGIKHHMIDIVDADATFSVAEYVNEARRIITNLNNEGKVPIIVGGTGLYVDALIYDYEFNNADVDLQYRDYLNNLAREKGNIYIHNMLEEIDPKEAQKIHYNNVKRVIRALEICKANGGRKSENKRSLHYDVLMFIVDTDRALLYDRINKRVDRMLENGLLQEVQSLRDRGITFDMQSMQGIGYKEWQGYFEGTKTIEEVTDMIKQNSRNYAKRQITWFHNKYRDIAHFIHYDEIDAAISLTEQFLNN